MIFFKKQIKKVISSLYEMYLDRKKMIFFKQFIGENKLFFDIGANIGNWTNIFYKLGVDVVAVEPQSHCAEKLRSRFKGNKKIRIVNKGIGHQNEKKQLHICSQADVLSTFTDEWKTGRFKEFSFDKQETVEMIVFEDLFRLYGRPDFCKIDVEGFEEEVLAGLKSRVPCLNFEYTSEFFHKTKNCLNILEKLGFTLFNYTRGENFKFVGNEWFSKEDVVRVIENNITKEKTLWGDIYVK